MGPLVLALANHCAALLEARPNPGG
jgi:hypothetical protein